MTRKQEIQKKIESVPPELVELAQLYNLKTTGYQLNYQFDILTLWAVIQFIIAAIKFFNNLGVENYSKMGPIQRLRFNFLVYRHGGDLGGTFETKKQKILELIDGHNLYSELKYNVYGEQ
jgi:hypothetical protein